MIEKALPEIARIPARERSRTDSRKELGFTVMELLVVIALLGILGAITIIVFNNLRPKMALTNVSGEIHSILQKARMAAIRRDLVVEVAVETELGGEVEEYNPTGIKNEWLVLRTVDAYNTKTEIDSYQMFRGYPPIHLWGNGETFIHGPSSNTFTGEIAYKNDGSIVSVGALRLSYYQVEDERARNVLEVAVPTLSGIPLVRKYLDEDDRPSTAKSVEFFEKTVATTTKQKALWVWY